jgi:hypothetical protein
MALQNVNYDEREVAIPAGKAQLAGNLARLASNWFARHLQNELHPIG